MGTHRPMRFLPFFVVEAARQLLVGFNLTDRTEAMDLSLHARAFIATHHPESGSQTVHHSGRVLWAEINHQKLRDNSGRWTDCHR